MRKLYQHKFRYPEMKRSRFREESGKVKGRSAKKQWTTEKHEATAASGDGMLKNAPEVLKKSDKAQEPIITKPDSAKLQGGKVATSPLQQSERRLSIPHVSVGKTLTQWAISSFMSQLAAPDHDLFWASFDGLLCSIRRFTLTHDICPHWKQLL
jgi:hypothetical protein